MKTSGEIFPITVLMSVFNGERYLKQSIKSILCQTFTDFEFIIIDDCSGDSSCKIIESYNDKRIKLIRNRINLGLSASLNIGIRASRGKYIVRFDSDDISLPERIEIQYRFMEENSQIGILGTGYYKIDQNGEGKDVYIYPKNEIDVKWKLLLGPIFPHPSVMFRKEILTNNDIYYNETFSATQDYELWSRMINYTDGTNLPLPLIKYRHHSTSISKSRPVIQEKLRRRVSAKLLSNLLKPYSISTKQVLLFEKVVKYDFQSLSLTELKEGFEVFFQVLKKFCASNYNSDKTIIKWKRRLLFNLQFRFGKHIRNNILTMNKNNIFPNIKLLQLRIIEKLLQYFHVFFGPKQSIYFPSSIIVYAIHLMDFAEMSIDRSIVR